MNKTWQQIFDELLKAKEANPSLLIADTTSKASVWRQFLETIAWALFNFQLAVKLHLQEIQDLILNQKTFNLRRYQKETLRFQYGFDLIAETDQFKPTFVINGVETLATEDQVEASKIIKYAACNRIISENKVKLILKIAPENMDDIFPDEVMTAFGRYIEEIAPSSDHVKFVNYKPDMLKFAYKIKYDPKVLLPSGMHIVNANFPVQDAINDFLKNLPFNGELSLQKFEAAILAAEGVDDLQPLLVETKWIVAGVGYGSYHPVNMAVIPESGRFKVEDFNGLQYVV